MAMDAAIATTFGTQTVGTTVDGAVGQREDLTDIISRIDPTETPFYSNGTKVGMSATRHDWQTQDLGAPDKTGQPEGFETTFAAPTPTVLVSNWAQIHARSWLVSNTLDVVDKAGRDRETVYQRTLKGLEIRRDLEASLTANDALSATDPRIMAGFAAWMVHGFFGTGANQAAGDGTGTTGNIPVPDLAATPTDDALTFATLDSVLEDIYNAGGKPTLMMMTPNAKRQFSRLDPAHSATVAGLPAASRYNQSNREQTTFIGAVGFYVSDYGDLECVCNRFQPGNSSLGGTWLDDGATNAIESIFLIDKRHYQVAALPGRSFMSQPLAKTGDADKGHVVHEGTLRNSAPRAHGMIVTPTI